MSLIEFTVAFKRLLVWLSLPLWIPVLVHAQYWKGILDPSRAIDWHAINPGASSINESRTQCGSTLTPSDRDDTTAINNAIAACGQHQYVLLGAGTFIVSNGITFGPIGNPVHNVTLRGSGPTKTIIRFTGANGCGGTYSDICINNSTQYSTFSSQVLPGGTNSASWTSGYTQGTTQITLDNVSGLAASSGSTIYTLTLDQPNDEAGIPAPPNGATEIGTTVTITTTHPHGFSVGQSVYVDNVGLANIASPSNNGATESGNTVTIITTNAHGVSTGQTVCITGVNLSGYNGAYTVQSTPTTTSFTYTNPTSGLAASGFGTVDTCYNNSAGGQAAYAITAVPTPTTFRYTSPYTGLAPSGFNSAIGYPATAAADNGQMFVCQTGGLCRAAGGQGAQGRLIDGIYHNQSQIVKVIAVKGNTVTIAPGLYATNWGTNGKTMSNGIPPGAWWTGPQVTGDAVENLTVDHTASSTASGIVGIKFFNSYNCWVSNVRSVNADQAHVRFQQSSHGTVTNSYFYGINHFQHTNSYGAEEFESGDDLIINNIFQHIANPILIGSTSGTVVAYNYTTDDFYTVSGWMQSGASLHDPGDTYVLFEGNSFPQVKADYQHGTHVLTTLFRNYMSGRDTNLFNGPTAAQTVIGTIPFQIHAHGRFFNMVGNVLGTAGYQSIYEDSPVTDPNSTMNVNQSIYALGWGSTQNSCSFLVCDPMASTTLMRWGNYDTATGATRWNASEVPSAINRFANALPATQTLPASLFLSSQPAFWKTPFGTPPWPAIGPDVTGGIGPGGHAWQIPAQSCYQHTPIDPAYNGVAVRITGASWSSNTVTINFPGAGNLMPNAVVTVAGLNTTGYNGTFGITGQTSNSISFTQPKNPGAYISGGTITYTPNILSFDAAACYQATRALNPPTNLNVVVH